MKAPLVKGVSKQEYEEYQFSLEQGSVQPEVLYFSTTCLGRCTFSLIMFFKTYIEF